MHATQEEVLSQCLSHSRSSPINYAIVNSVGAELCQTQMLLIRGSWKEGLASVFSCVIATFLDLQVQFAVPLNTCNREVK